MSVLAIILLSIIIGSWLLKRLAPYLLLYIVKRTMNKQFGKTQPQTRKEGAVNINRAVSPEKKIDKNIGDYVEFEEIT